MVSPLLESILAPVKARVIAKDMDWWCLIDGREGVAKSTLGCQIACWLDPTFNKDRICFNLNELEKQIQTAPKFCAVMLDEGFAVANSRGAMTELNRRAILLAAESRQKNLFIIICAPSIFDMDKYFAIHRTNCLFHVYFDKSYNRGQATFFPYAKKKSLYIYGKKMYSYARPKAQGEPIGFLKGYGNIDETEYRTKKLKAFENRAAAMTPSQVLYHERDAFIMELWNSFPTQHKLEMFNAVRMKYGLPPKDESFIKTIVRKWRNECDAIKAASDYGNGNSANAIRNESSNGIQIQPGADPAAMQPLSK